MCVALAKCYETYSSHLRKAQGLQQTLLDLTQVRPSLAVATAAATAAAAPAPLVLSQVSTDTAEKMLFDRALQSVPSPFSFFPLPATPFRRATSTHAVVRSAILQAKDGAVDETYASYKNSLAHYRLSLQLLEHLHALAAPRDDEEADAHDRVVLNRLITHVRSRIDVIEEKRQRVREQRDAEQQQHISAAQPTAVGASRPKQQFGFTVKPAAPSAAAAAPSAADPHRRSSSGRIVFD
jgi:hypothetical protein